MGRVTIRIIIETYKRVRSIRGTARELGIDRKTVRTWVNRGKSIHTPHYIAFRGLERKTTRPHTIHKKLSRKHEVTLINLRLEHGEDQYKLAKQLRVNYAIKVSPKTVYNTIRNKRPDLLHKKGRYRRPLFQNGHAMRPKNVTTPGYLQMDVKYVTPELSGLSFTCYEYGVIDIFSRYKVALILPVLDEAGSILALKWAIQSMPLKIVYVQTDNGLEYQNLFHNTCEKQNIVHYHIHKNSPNENAVVERSFKTDQEEFFFRLKDKPIDINDLNKKFQEYLSWYNTKRYHFGINLKTPLQALEEFIPPGENVVTD
jgi:transposase InsO family protein